jgi:hypothetical protein
MKKLICLFTTLGLLGWSTNAVAQEENGQKKTVIAYSGKVVRVDPGDPAMVVVKTDKADLNVELAPMTFIEQNKLTLTPDSEVTVRGYETLRSGRNVFVATEVNSGGTLVKLRDADFKPLWVTTTKVEPQQPATAIVTYSGKVKTFQRADPALAVIETDKGAITAELGPMTYLEENKLLLNPNDVITVRGYNVTRGDRDVFVVTDVTTAEPRTVRFRSEKRDPLWVKTTTETVTLKPGDITDLSGDVTVVETTDTPDGRYVTIKTDAGPRVIAVGPGPYLEKQRYVFTPGDRIRVRGWASTRAGRPVFLASEVHRGDTVWRFRRPDGRVLWID